MWDCPKCGERAEEGFAVCWSCGTARDGTEDPGFRREPGGRSPADGGDTAVGERPGPAAGPRACARCGSGKIVTARLCGLYDDTCVGVGFDRRPEALFLTGRVRAELMAAVCGSCGHAELFVPDAGEFWKSYASASATPKTDNPG